MDMDILRALLNNYEDMGNIAQPEDYKNLTREALICPQSDVFNTLCASLSSFLCYKISKEAYQRYSIRMLDILRRWCRITSNFEHLQTFTTQENSSKFIVKLLDKYLTDDVLSECYLDDPLISLTTAVIRLTAENSSFVHYVDRLLVRLLQLESNEKIEKCLHNALHANLDLQLSTKEEIYISQKFKLVEEPLLNNFVYMFPNSNKENCMDSRNNEELLNQLIEFSVKSTRIFQLIFSFLKELLVQMQYAPAILHFIELILKRVSVCCQNKNTDILDLYPRKLHSCIILLRIKPEHHTVQTKEYTLQTIKQILIENKDTLLILMSHFPEWLKFFVDYVTNDIKS